jgi:hypothetical protein
MAEPINYVFKYKEIAEALVKYQDIHEGIWGIYIEFGIQGANIGTVQEDNILPAAIVPVVGVGLQRFEKLTSLSVDAAEVNPVKQQKATKNKGIKNSGKKSLA